MNADPNYIIKHEFGSLIIYEQKHPWFNVFRSSRKVYWSCTRLCKQAGPFPTVYDALFNYRIVRETMKTTDKLPETPKNEIKLPEMPQKPLILPKNVIFMDFRNKKRISIKV